MISVTGKKLSELLTEIYDRYGYAYTAEGDCKFKPAQRDEIYNKVYIEKNCLSLNSTSIKSAMKTGRKSTSRTVAG